MKPIDPRPGSRRVEVEGQVEVKIGHVFSSVSDPRDPRNCIVVVQILNGDIYTVPAGGEGSICNLPGLGRYCYRVESFEAYLPSVTFGAERGARALAVLLPEGADFARSVLAVADSSRRCPLQLAREARSSLRNYRGGAHVQVLTTLKRKTT